LYKNADESIEANGECMCFLEVSIKIADVTWIHLCGVSYVYFLQLSIYTLSHQSYEIISDEIYIDNRKIQNLLIWSFKFIVYGKYNSGWFVSTLYYLLVYCEVQIAGEFWERP
jgi:hypothetical protein